MAQEAKVRVRIDTARAKSELRDLTRTAESTAGRVSMGVRAAAGAGAASVLTRGRSATESVTSSVKASTLSGIGDIASETLGPLGAQLSKFFLGDMPAEAKASISAREATIQTFGATAGRIGHIPPGAKEWFAQVRSLRLEEERGRQMFESSSDFRSTAVKGLLDRLLSGIGEELSKAVKALAEQLAIWR